MDAGSDARTPGLTALSSAKELKSGARDSSKGSALAFSGEFAMAETRRWASALTVFRGVTGERALAGVGGGAAGEIKMGETGVGGGASGARKTADTGVGGGAAGVKKAETVVCRWVDGMGYALAGVGGGARGERRKAETGVGGGAAVAAPFNRRRTCTGDTGLPKTALDDTADDASSVAEMGMKQSLGASAARHVSKRNCVVVVSLRCRDGEA
jgi:hypothetical protein